MLVSGAPLAPSQPFQHSQPAFHSFSYLLHSPGLGGEFQPLKIVLAEGKTALHFKILISLIPSVSKNKFFPTLCLDFCFPFLSVFSPFAILCLATKTLYPGKDESKTPKLPFLHANFVKLEM